MTEINVVCVHFDGKKEGERLRRFMELWFKGGIYFGDGDIQYYQEFELAESDIDIYEFNDALRRFEEYEELLYEQFGDISEN